MAKPKKLIPQLKIKNNFTDEIFDVPATVYETYNNDFLYNKRGEPKFTIIETVEKFLERIKNAPPPEPPLKEMKPGRPRKHVDTD